MPRRPPPKARTVQAEADVKPTQASGREQQAAPHRNEALTFREELNQQFERADEMDPHWQTSDTAREDSETRDTPPIQKVPR